MDEKAYLIHTINRRHDIAAVFDERTRTGAMKRYLVETELDRLTREADHEAFVSGPYVVADSWGCCAGRESHEVFSLSPAGRAAVADGPRAGGDRPSPCGRTMPRTSTPASPCA